MKVKDILKIASMFVNLEKEIEPFILGSGEEAIEESKKDFEILKKCLNLVYQDVCGHLTTKLNKVVKVVDGKILYEDIDSNVKTIFSIKDVCTLRNIKFTTLKTGVVVDSSFSEVLVVYSLKPEELDVDGDVFCFGAGINEKCLALGVASEYFYIKSFYEEAEMFNKRYKEMLKFLVKERRVVIPKRRWK